MLHGFLQTDAGGTALADRRRDERHPQAREIVLAWDHALGQRLRFRVLDRSDHGARIIGTLPILSGMTGLAISLLPGDEPVNRVILVKWVAEPNALGEYEAGIEFTS